MTDLSLLPAGAPRRAGLAAFGLTMGLWAALAVGVLAPLALLPRLAAALVAGAAVAAAFRALPRRHAEALYRLWARAARLYAAGARRALLLLSHAVVSVVSLAGTSLALSRPAPGGSMWHPRQTLPTVAYDSQFDAAGAGWVGHPWRGAIDWSIRSGNVWVIFLLPFLCLLSLLDTEDPDRYPAGIYTLF